MNIFGSPKIKPTETPDPELASREVRKQKKVARDSFLAFRRRQEVQKGILRGNPGLKT